MANRETISRVRPDWLEPARDEGSTEVLGLAIAWSAAEPGRLGEVGLMRPGIPELVLGRGGRAATDTTNRLVFYRQRPGGNVECPPIEGPGISRNQLLIRARADELEVERVGRCALAINGREVERGVVQADDVVSLKHQLVLYCVRRPLRIRAPRAEERRAPYAFGGADEHGIVGESRGRGRVRDQLAFCASADDHVLILGESGCGKELAARAVHQLSRRRGRDHGLSQRSDLPGRHHRRRAVRQRQGLPEPRDGRAAGHGRRGRRLHPVPRRDCRAPARPAGAPAARPGRGGEYQRLGEARPPPRGPAPIAATNRDPSELKHDLLGRLTLRITLPGLQDRREDIPLLINHLLKRAVATNPGIGEDFFEDWDGHAGTPRVDPELVSALLKHQFTQHVRQLDAMLWLAISGSHGRYIALTPEVRALLRDDVAPAGARTTEPTAKEIQDACDRHGGNVSKAWPELGLKSRYALYRLMSKHGFRRRPDG